LKNIALKNIQKEEEQERLKKIKRQDELKEKISLISTSLKQQVVLNVGGREFQTSLNVLTSLKDNVLYYLFSQDMDQLSRDGEGQVFLDIDGDIFGHILKFMRSSHAVGSIDLLQVSTRGEEFSLAVQLEIGDLYLYRKMSLKGIDLSQKCTDGDRLHSWNI
jgi:hypothetical protein